VHNERQLASFFQALVPGFLENLGDTLPTHRKDVVTRVIRALPDLKIHRVKSGKPLTRCHGDPHFWNILYPKDPSRHGCIFVDWEDWRWDIGAQIWRRCCYCIYHQIAETKMTKNYCAYT